MALKDELLREFSLHPMTVINGEELASRYHVSRAAVWKAVKALKNEGFDIVSSASGYTFTENNDFLSSEAVSRIVPEKRSSSSGVTRRRESWISPFACSRRLQRRRRSHPVKARR